MKSQKAKQIMISLSHHDYACTASQNMLTFFKVCESSSEKSYKARRGKSQSKKTIQNKILDLNT